MHNSIPPTSTANCKLESIEFKNIRNNKVFPKDKSIMLNNHHDMAQIISFLGKYFFSLVIRSYLYQKQLNQHTNKSLVHLLLFHLIEEDFVNQIWNYCISNRFQGLLLYNESMVIYLSLFLRHS